MNINVGIFFLLLQNCTSNIVAVGISAKVRKSELVKIALGSKECVLKVVSPDDLDSRIISKIEMAIKKSLSFNP